MKLIKTYEGVNEASKSPVPKNVPVRQMTEGRRLMFLSFAKIHYFDSEEEAQKCVI